MSALLARIMICSCKCRICKTEYQSLLVSTACCREAKALDRRNTTDSILISDDGSESKQSKLKEFTHHELDWKNLLLELEEFNKSR